MSLTKNSIIIKGTSTCMNNLVQLFVVIKYARMSHVSSYASMMLLPLAYKCPNILNTVWPVRSFIDQPFATMFNHFITTSGARVCALL